jgi:hypothetical protein
MHPNLRPDRLDYHPPFAVLLRGVESASAIRQEKSDRGGIQISARHFE